MKSALIEASNFKGILLLKFGLSQNFVFLDFNVYIVIKMANIRDVLNISIANSFQFKSSPNQITQEEGAEISDVCKSIYGWAAAIDIYGAAGRGRDVNQALLLSVVELHLTLQPFPGDYSLGIEPFDIPILIEDLIHFHQLSQEISKFARLLVVNPNGDSMADIA
jgi:hypothetical protein